MAGAASNPGFVTWRSDLALALAAVGERDEALHLCAEQERLAESFGVTRELAMSLRGQALVTGRAGAVAPLKRAVYVLRESPARLELARCLIDLGGALRRLGERRAARESLREGLDLAQRCGAKRLANTSHEELVASGAKTTQTGVQRP